MERDEPRGPLTQCGFCIESQRCPSPPTHTVSARQLVQQLDGCPAGDACPYYAPRLKLWRVISWRSPLNSLDSVGVSVDMAAFRHRGHCAGDGR